MSIKSDILKVKAAATVLSTVSCEIRNAALESVAKALEENKEEIFKQNAKDLENAEKSKSIRLEEYKELREKREPVRGGLLAGKLLVDVLEADLVEAM